MNIEELNKEIARKVKEECISSRGMKIKGIIVSTKMRNTVTVEREFSKLLHKFKRVAIEKSKVHVHVPEGISLQLGDIVEAQQTRKLSKTKNWVITRVISKAGE
ncbi:MAG: 30S ribosomal protein S17 [Candidatus Micrarchaeota archaeon]|nr:30S ribosomal protein S17 [Candidatus Micrarchaeota archaeon]